ncbi:alkaline phosphatase [Arthrobacter pigmenti]
MKKMARAVSTVAMGALVLGSYVSGAESGQLTATAADLPASMQQNPSGVMDKVNRNNGDRGRGNDDGNPGHGDGDNRHGGKHDRWNDVEAENIILMVGDGMGTAQRNAIRLAYVGLTGELAMDSMPHAGRAHTNSADPKTFVTDSAAAATAMASGIKTYNGAIGMNLEREPVTTVLEVAEDMGMSTGLVTTSQVTDATPAAFGSHVLDRDAQSKIAKQYLTSSHPEVILGGGEDYWYPEGNPGKHQDNPPADPTEQSKGTEGNLVELAQQQGYEYVWDREGLQEADGGKLLGLFANEEMFQYGEKVEEVYEPTVPLTEMTSTALDILSDGPASSDEGFFLMVEEEGTDAMSHVNDAALTIKSGIEFDKSVALAKDFAQRDGETLVIVVGDHQTGGMTIEALDDPEAPDESGDGLSAEDGPISVAGSDQQFMVDWTTGGHAAIDVSLTAMGPGASLLTGVFENTHIHDVMLQVLRGDEDSDDDDDEDDD